MAESSPPRDSRPSNKREKLKKNEIREVPIDLTPTTKTDPPKPIHSCDICMGEYVFTVSLYLCYLCGQYLCEKCSKTHDGTHALVERKHEESERSEKANDLVLKTREKFGRKGGDLDGDCVEIIGRVDVKHELDKNDCYITGLSGLGNRKWVAVDQYNDCIKIFCSVSNTLLRYIKFGSKPWDVTEIKVKQKCTDPDSASGSKTDISGAARDEPDKQCLLAVTFPDMEQIWLIDVNKTPAVKTKTIKMDKKCSSIDLSEDKIFILCYQYAKFRSPYYIYILSTEGKQLKVVRIPGLPTQSIKDLAVYKGRVYLSDNINNKVLCINVEDGKTISELELNWLGSFRIFLKEWWGPNGISVDPNSGVVYMCEYDNNKVYKLSPDLRKYEPLSLVTDYTDRPYKLCFINNKLYFSHASLWRPSLKNVVTVVHVLT